MLGQIHKIYSSFFLPDLQISFFLITYYVEVFRFKKLKKTIEKTYNNLFKKNGVHKNQEMKKNSTNQDRKLALDGK
jgi:hypothetical protein